MSDTEEMNMTEIYIEKRKLSIEDTTLSGLKDWLKDHNPAMTNAFFEDDEDGGFKGVLETEEGDYFFRYYLVESSGSYTWWSMSSFPAAVIPGGAEVATAWKATLDDGVEE